MKSMEEKTYFHRVNELTPTRFWINNVTQEEAKRALAEGACGCTQNPAYVWKMMQRESELPEIQQLIMRLRDQGVARDQILIAVQRELVGRIAKLFLPLYQQSQGRWGYVSIQGDPFHEDCDSIVKTGLFNREAGENIMIKIPVTVKSHQYSGGSGRTDQCDGGDVGSSGHGCRSGICGSDKPLRQEGTNLLLAHHGNSGRISV